MGFDGLSDDALSEIAKAIRARMSVLEKRDTKLRAETREAVAGELESVLGAIAAERARRRAED